MGSSNWNPTASRCKTTSDDICEPNAKIIDYKTWGEAAVPPDMIGGALAPASYAQTKRSNGSCPGDSGDDLILDSGSNSTPISGDPDDASWYASSYETTSGGSVPSGSADMDTLDDCEPGGTTACTQSASCNGAYNAEVTLPPEPGNPEDCVDYEDIFVRLKLETPATEDAGAKLRYPVDSDCVSGTGRFHLAPLWSYDYDGDGKDSAIFLPMQEGGTGVMTNSAWITEAELVSGVNGKPLRIVKSSQPVAFDMSDQVENKVSGSTVVSGTHTYSTGNYGGNAYFVAEELSLLELDDYKVDLTWTCTTSQSGLDFGQGWQIRASDLGCSDYIQKMTLRYYTAPNRVEVQQYGNPNYTLVRPTSTTVDGQAFSFEEWGLTVDATLLSWSSTGASVRVDEISLLGVDICTTGTYNLSPE